jgi:hypothetical protein
VARTPSHHDQPAQHLTRLQLRLLLLPWLLWVTPCCLQLQAWLLASPLCWGQPWPCLMTQQLLGFCMRRSPAEVCCGRLLLRLLRLLGCSLGLLRRLQQQ